MLEAKRAHRWCRSMRSFPILNDNDLAAGTGGTGQRDILVCSTKAGLDQPRSCATSLKMQSSSMEGFAPGRGFFDDGVVAVPLSQQQQQQQQQ
ncbi:hypothetical protein AK812_SmicGene675 [Symbiodinium microadriaticum]|uniref:Uncharacterized protein n=1 Tax=Symbiodinium microadriaticum TaxID=2951 RepID=A0A1Q9F608_SYMMI|nr:hypothetical protein AK812_SmicGene675 [Symbiodinium microadriaticum]